MTRYERIADDQTTARHRVVWTLESWRVQHIRAHVMQPELVRRVWVLSADVLNAIEEKLEHELR